MAMRGGDIDELATNTKNTVAATDLDAEAGRSTKRMKVPMDSAWRMCLKILNALDAEPEAANAWAFRKPPSGESTSPYPEVPDINVIIRKPRDLRPVRRALLAGKYTHPTRFARDVRLVFDKAMRCHQTTGATESHASVRELKNKFDEMFCTVAVDHRTIHDVDCIAGHVVPQIDGDCEGVVSPPRGPSSQASQGRVTSEIPETGHAGNPDID